MDQIQVIKLNYYQILMRLQILIVDRSIKIY